MTGADFEHRLARRQYRLPLDSMVLFCGELIDITACLRHQGIEYHDLRHADVSMHPDGGLCLPDFGIAACGLGLSGDVCYMAPEQWAGPRGDARADSYPLGIVSHGDGVLVLFVQPLAYNPGIAAETTFRPPSRKGPGLSKTLEKVILNVMAADRQGHYAWVEDLGEDLPRPSGVPERQP